MDIFIPIFVFFTIFVMCSLCGFCCKKQNEGAIYSTPVVITSQTHQPVGSPTAYPVGGGGHSYHTTIVSSPLMPMPDNNGSSYPNSQAPYPAVNTGYAYGQQPTPYQPPTMPFPATGGMPYPPQTGAAPYPTGGSAPYPPQTGGAPYPTGGAAPYPTGGSAPYPTGGSAPYPDNSTYPAQQNMNPPSYTDVVKGENFQKQAPYNPSFS